MEKFADLEIWIQKAGDLLASNHIYIDGHSYTGPSLDTTDFGRKDYANQFCGTLVSMQSSGVGSIHKKRRRNC